MTTRLFCKVESGLGTHLAAYYKKPLFSNTAFFYITSFGQMAIYDYLEAILRNLLKQNGYQIMNYLKTDIIGNPDNKKATLSFGNIKFNWNKPAEWCNDEKNMELEELFFGLSGIAKLLFFAGLLSCSI